MLGERRVSPLVILMLCKQLISLANDWFLDGHVTLFWSLRLCRGIVVEASGQRVLAFGRGGRG